MSYGIKSVLIASMLLAGCASNPPVEENVTYGLLEGMPLDSYMDCAYMAFRTYNIPPVGAIQLSCSDEIHELDMWTIKLIERTGVTVSEAGDIIGDQMY